MWEMNAPPLPPTLLGINPSTPYAMPPSCQDSEVTTGGGGGGLRTLSTPNISSMLDHKGGGTTYLYANFRFAYIPITLIFIWRLLLRHIFSFSAFSFDAYFHSAHSPNASISFRAFSYDAYFHYASSLTTLTLIPRILLRCLKTKEGAKRKWHFKKFLRNPKC